MVSDHHLRVDKGRGHGRHHHGTQDQNTEKSIGRVPAGMDQEAFDTFIKQKVKERYGL